jgi:hypothetical protein
LERAGVRSIVEYLMKEELVMVCFLELPWEQVIGGVMSSLVPQVLPSGQKEVRLLGKELRRRLPKT